MQLHRFFIAPVLLIYMYAILVYVVLGWLMIGGVVDNRNQTVRSIYQFLFQIIEPVARPIRRVLPPLGSLDLSVLVILLAIPFLRVYFIPRVISLIPF